jgi:hypothetical protein
MKAARAGMALPAAIAAMIVLAGFAVLANISATAAIRESRALRDVTVERMQRATVRARALFRLSARPRAELIAAGAAIGASDTTLVVSALAWPWHTFTVTAAGVKLIAEFARGIVPIVPWCTAVAYATAANITTGTLIPETGCTDRVQITSDSAASFDSALVADLVGTSNADTLTVSGTVTGVVRTSRSVLLAAGADITGLVIAPVVRILSGASVRGLVVSRDSITIMPGASVTADRGAVFSVLCDGARLVPVGRRGLLLPR